jgi:hypothetical protein
MIAVRWATGFLAVVAFITAYNTPQSWGLFWAVLFGIAMTVVFTFTFNHRSRKPTRLARKQDPMEWASGPELSRLDRLDGVGNRTPKEQK